MIGIYLPGSSHHLSAVFLDSLLGVPIRIPLHSVSAQLLLQYHLADMQQLLLPDAESIWPAANAVVSVQSAGTEGPATRRFS